MNTYDPESVTHDAESKIQSQLRALASYNVYGHIPRNAAPNVSEDSGY